MTFDADVQVDLEPIGLGDVMLQLNAINLLDEEYLGSISTSTNALAIADIDTGPGVVARGAQTVRYQIGAPQTFQIQLKSKF